VEELLSHPEGVYISARALAQNLDFVDLCSLKLAKFTGSQDIPGYFRMTLQNTLLALVSAGEKGLEWEFVIEFVRVVDGVDRPLQELKKLLDWGIIEVSSETPVIFKW